MNNKHIAGRLMALLRTVYGQMQTTNCRRYQREVNSAFQRCMEDRIISEARYASPMAHI